MSVDFDTLGREEILKRIELLGINAQTNMNTEKLRANLRNLAKIHHPIHEYLSQLTNDKLKNVYLIVFPMRNKQNADRMRVSIANDFFKNYPCLPLTALKFCVEKSKVSELNDLKQKFEKNYETNTPEMKSTPSGEQQSKESTQNSSKKTSKK